MINNNNVLHELLNLLKLEQIEKNIFRGQSQDLGFGNIFGGQVLGQSLSAASKTIPNNLRVHSLHAYFLRAGDPRQPIVYTVDCIRDGRSFSTRRSVAIQNGKPIFTMAASFQVREKGFSHQDNMPKVPGPEGIESELEMAIRLKEFIPNKIRHKILCNKPIEIRHINPIDPFSPEKLPATKYVWFRSTGEVPRDAAVNQYLMAYASDFNLVLTSLNPHGHTFWEREMQVASLDHAMWFHRDFHFNDWFLYAMESPSASGARGLAIGRVFTRSGELVATVTQEGLLRYHDIDKSAHSND